MRVEIETSSEGMRYHHNRQANAILELCPLLYHRSSKLGQAMEEMAVLLKDWPEDIRHRKHDAYIRNVGEGAPPLPLPLQRGSMPATRTGSHLAGVRNEFLLSFRRIDFSSQR